MARVLLVDDDPGAIATIGPLLRLAHHEFAGALTGRDGVRLASEFDPDVALIDLSLPDISGIEVMRALRVHTPWTACVVITGQPLSVLRSRGDSRRCVRLAEQASVQRGHLESCQAGADR